MNASANGWLSPGDTNNRKAMNILPFMQKLIPGVVFTRASKSNWPWALFRRLWLTNTGQHADYILRHSQGRLCSKKTLNKLAQSDQKDAAGPSIWLPPSSSIDREGKRGVERAWMCERETDEGRKEWAQCEHLDKAPPHYSALIRDTPDTLIKEPCCPLFRFNNSSSCSLNYFYSITSEL